MKYFILILSIVLFSFQLNSQTGKISKVWVSDLGDGTYKNPVIHADYSDPDVIRVGDDYFMTASSFNCIPGLPILHSKDLVNWELVNYALPQLTPFEVFDNPQHGNGVWAPCLRYHNKEFYIYYPDPDFGIYMIKAKDPKGIWSEPILVKKGKGLIDPTPFWDSDGKVYLAHAFAGSRAGIKSIIVLGTMNDEGTRANNDDIIVYNGQHNQPTIEGPKLYKRNGYYYIFAPAGGVSTGWQLVLRSKNIYGPYEEKIVMEQGTTKVNGPHQGAWVQTQSGEDWFIHFQDKAAYGRVVHLQPMKWVNDWPVIGLDEDADGKGNPVEHWNKPNVGKRYNIETPPDSDEFNDIKLGLEWQWHANPQIYWGFPTNQGCYTLFCYRKPHGFVNLFDVPNLLLQKFPAEEFSASTRITFNARYDNEQFGFLIMGLDYSYLSLIQKEGKLFLSQNTCMNADSGEKEILGEQVEMLNRTIFMRANIKKGGRCKFSYSYDGISYKEFGNSFIARQGKWIGAKIGFFALRNGFINDSGSVDIDWFRIEKPGKK